MTEKRKVEINVIDWKNGEPREVSISFPDLNQMLTISAEGARSMAFMLMQCADYIDPPFGEQVSALPPGDDDNEESFFGPYPSENEEDDEEDENPLDN